METTLTLRNRLGFNEVALWKQFCARRLHLIHTLSLNLRKASEQEEQVRVLAAELCAEYGFGPYAQTDFEKLLIAGIQSVRRNQKRSARHPNGYTDIENAKTQAEGGVSNEQGPAANKGNNTPGYVTIVSPSGLNSHAPGSQYFDQVTSSLPERGAVHMQNGSSSPNNSNNSPPAHHQAEHNMNASSNHHNNSRNPPGGPLATPMFQSLVVRLEVLRDMIGAGSATWIESSAPTVAHMSAYGVLSTAVAAASVHGKLTSAESTAMRDSILEGPLLESLRLALNPSLTQTRLLERIGALAASLVHGPHLLSALQALCVSLAQASHGSENDMRYMLKPLAGVDIAGPGNSKPQSAEKLAQTPDGSHDKTHQVPDHSHNQSQIHNQPVHHMHPPHPQPINQPPILPQHMMPQPPLIIQPPGYQPQPMVTQPQQIPGQINHQIASAPVGPPQQLAQFIMQHNPSEISMGMPDRSFHSQTPSGQAPVQPTVNTEHQQQQQQQQQQPQQQQQSGSVSVRSPVRSDSPESRSTNGSVSSMSSLASAASSASSVSSLGIHVGGPDRLVTLQYNDKSLKLTYSPMKATPPTISEIIDNARLSFSIPASTVVRIKDVHRNKIIETNSELIDAFTQQQVKLELLLPPPMLMTMEPKRDILGGETRFTHLAPILRKSV